MKKFISLIIGVAVLVSFSSCREADEWTTTENTPTAVANVANNTTNTVSESTTNVTNDEDGDPPKKDDMNW